MGHWDLRDVNVEAYVDAWKAFVDALAAAAPETTRLVWRTNPAYSFRRHDDREVEYRTNAKLAKAHALQLAHLRRSRYDVHDTFGITLPRFFDANSAHHYIGFSSFAHGAASVDEAGTCPGGACCGGGVGGAPLGRPPADRAVAEARRAVLRRQRRRPRGPERAPQLAV
ncbi:hypothetical protein JL720_9782 [Aureococcus anophagefferens]|nr:hypothetical protein JL720_9782 [Aureococcus anophagefferens]